MKSEARGKAYWRSLDDLADTPEFRELVRNEFPSFADEMATPTSRRRFLKLMGASTALAGMVACRWPVEEIVPFAARPEGFVPGVPTQYATAMELDGVATGLLVTSYDGRPIKVEGNPGHPYSRGATDAIAQASLLGLYDPDRSRRVIRSDGASEIPTDWSAFASFASGHFERLRADRGRGLRILCEASFSPSLADMRARLLRRFPEAAWHEYEPFSWDNEREGLRRVFGKPFRTHLRLDLAEVIACFDADLFLTHPARVRHAGDFARGRRADGGRMNRLWAVESDHSLTGSRADRRAAVPSGRIPAVVGRLAAALFLEHGLAMPPGLGRLRGALERFAGVPEASPTIAAMARDLVEHRGRSVIVAGPGQPPEVHALVHVLNRALGNSGGTVRYAADPDPDRPPHVEAIRALTGAMAGGEVDTLLILGGNPAFDAPADLEFARHLGSVGTSIHLSLHRDETSRACGWHLPRAHFLESWADARACDGTASAVQPLIEPLWGGKSAIEVLAAVLGEPPLDGYGIVRRTCASLLGGADFEKRWRRALHDGVIPGTAWTEAAPAGPTSDGWVDALVAHAGAPEPAADGRFEISFRRDATIHDGRFANNGWLQELPDPMTKLTWDNALLVAPADAEHLGLVDGDVVRIRHEARELEMPVYAMPGQAAGSVAVCAGYGRRHVGSVGEGVGFDVYSIRTSAAMYAGSCSLEKTGSRYPLASTQDHGAIDAIGAEGTRARLGALVREAELEDFRRDPDHAIRGEAHHEPARLWREHEYDGHRWGMSIDLSACVGCGACVVACQAENNVPVVGKNEVARGHEMHWIRVDRYFSGDPERPGVSHQPVTCHHCENAPCEQVCPVAATVHDGEGLNVMVYNRCIGTRYCSNNCPFKVRRFNWFNNHRNPTDLDKMVHNPEVTVRGRGVMEKCTFCVQRISSVKIRAKNERRPVRDGEIVPACAQACPARAIEFGDLNDPDSRVRKLREDPRSYTLLDELYLKPRTSYLAGLRNRGPGGGPADASDSDERRHG